MKNYRADKLWVDARTGTRTHGHTDTDNDNTRRPILSSGKKRKRISDYFYIDSCNGLQQFITRINAALLPNERWIDPGKYSFQKIHLKISSAKWQAIGPDDVLKTGFLADSLWCSGVRFTDILWALKWNLVKGLLRVIMFLMIKPQVTIWHMSRYLSCRGTYQIETWSNDYFRKKTSTYLVKFLIMSPKTLREMTPSPIQG